MKFRSIFFLFALLISSACFGEMYIYLKNGGEHRVHKIVFKGQQADLYMLDGRVLTLPVSDLDLPASGIGSPTGTYGEKNLGGGGSHITKPAPPIINEAARQEELGHQWESSEKSAVALRDIGRFHQGEVVRIVEHKLSEEPVPMDYYYGSEPMNSQVLDQAYIVIYRNADGTYGKKMIDAVTFTTNFKIQTTATLEPPKVLTGPSTLSSQAQNHPEETAPTPDPQKNPTDFEHALDTPKTVPPVPHKSNALAIVLVCVVGVVAGGAVFVALAKRKKPFVDSSKFRTYEEELRDFEIEIWLKNGKTLDQLIDICIKKFYQDNPAALAVAMKMIKATPKSSVMPYLIKQSERSPAEAELLYNEMERRLDWIRQMIQSISNRTGIAPGSPKEAAATEAAPARPVTGPPPLPPRPGSGPPPLPPRAEQAPSPAPQPQNAPPAPQPAPVAQPQPAQNWESWGVVVDLEKEEAAAAASGLPEYMKNLVEQLGTFGKTP